MFAQDEVQWASSQHLVKSGIKTVKTTFCCTREQYMASRPIWSHAKSCSVEGFAQIPSRKSAEGKQAGGMCSAEQAALIVESWRLGGQHWTLVLS